MDTPNDSPLLSQGNAAFRAHDYEQALLCYQRALRQVPEVLRPSLEFNIELTRRRLVARLGDAAQGVLQRIADQLRLEDEINVLTPHFDRDYYLANNPDVAQAGIDPALHYCCQGWREGRDPHPGFSTQCYLDNNPDVVDAGLNPFRHFIEHGRDEGRCHLPALAAGSVHPVNCEQIAPMQWRTLNEDPQFILNAQHYMPTPGWYWLAAHVVPTKPFDVGKLYLDLGNGFSESAAFVFGVKKNAQAIGRVLHIDKTPVSLRLDPQGVAGDFEIRGFAIVPIPEASARHWMVEYLQKKDPNDHKVAALSLDALLARYESTVARDSTNPEYQEWIELVEKPSLPTNAQVQALLAKMGDPHPVISIITPVYNTPEACLRECIESVLRQSYPHWQLCLADDCSSQPHVRQVLEEYAAKDARIQVVFRPKNGHISAASNSALELATGDWVAFLDHDDVLPEHALFFVVQAILEHPEAKFIYSDEDVIDIYGKRLFPHFKSDWNPDLFLSQNYICHLSVIPRSLVTAVGGFRTGVEGSQDYDLFLRCLHHLKHHEIHHIPRILYHWRAIPGSAALDSNEKPYTTQAGIKALTDYFAEQGPGGVVINAGRYPNTYRVIWPLPDPPPLVSLLIPTRDKKELVETAVGSILDKTTYPNYEILILDNGSVEPSTLAWFDEIQHKDPRVRVLRWDHPFNYSAINNFGVRHARGSIIGLINNDVEVISPDWLIEMVRHASRPDIGCVGAKLYYADGTIQHGGVILSIKGLAGHAHQHLPHDHPGYFARLHSVQNLSAVTAACLLVRKSVYEQVGGLDEDDLKVAFNDVDFCLKVREAGYRNLWTPYAELYHHESLSRGNEDTPEKQARFRHEVETMKSRWGEKLQRDPYYNPNLTKDREDFSIGV